MHQGAQAGIAGTRQGPQAGITGMHQGARARITVVDQGAQQSPAISKVNKLDTNKEKEAVSSSEFSDVYPL